MKIRKDFLPLSRPSIGEKEKSEVIKCLESGWVTTGPVCASFEDKFRDLTGAHHAISLSSGTALFLLMYIMILLILMKI